MIRASPQLPWADHLKPEDLELINQFILPASWYPMEAFQRIGMAAFKLVAKENFAILRAYGSFLADRMKAENPGLVQAGRPAETIKCYQAIHERLCSFKDIELLAKRFDCYIHGGTGILACH